MGLATGSMMYGSTGKAGQAVAIGVAGYQMHRGFQKSALTMESTTQSVLVGMGLKTKEQVASTMDAVASNPTLFDGKSAESMKQAENLLKAIGDRLIEQVGRPEYKTKIRNEIDSVVKRNPAAIPATIDRLMNDLQNENIPASVKYKPEKVEQGKQNIDTTAIRSACQAYADFACKKEIYSQMQAGQAMGISKDSYVQACTEGFVETYHSVDNPTKTVEKMIETSRSNSDKITNQAMSMTPEALGDVSDALENERAYIEDAIKWANDNEKRAYEDRLRDLEKVEDAMSEAIIRDKDKALRESQRKILEQVKKNCEKEIRRLVSEVETIEQNSIIKSEDNEEIKRIKSEINGREIKVKSINDILNPNA